MGLRNKLFHKSPFIMSTFGGGLAVVADIVWLTGELSTHFGLISETTYIFIRLGILASLIVGLGLCAYGISLYINNGYVTADRAVYKECLLEKRQTIKRKKIL